MTPFTIERVGEGQFTIRAGEREDTVTGDLSEDRGRGELLLAVTRLTRTDPEIIGTAKRMIDALADGVERVNSAEFLPEIEAPALPFDSRCTDAANGQRFADYWTGHYTFIRGIGWAFWDGRRWKPCEGMMLGAATEVAREIYMEAKAEPGKESAAQLAGWATRSLNLERLRAMLACAAGLLAEDASRFDADPFLFNTQNGILDLQHGELKPHDPRARCMKLAPVIFDPAATCPVFDTFLQRVFKGSAGLIRYVQGVLGYCVCGCTDIQILPIFWGVGANGKSSLLSAVSFVSGDYSGIAPETLLTQTKQVQHPTELAGLRGLRLVVAAETEGNSRLRTQFLKRLTGEDRLTARLMRQDFFEFARTFKTILQTNNKPKVTEDSEAVWRRLRLVPFDVVIPPSERDTHLLDKLKGEASGILNWLLAGCMAVRREGLESPAEVVEASRVYREESDPVGDFIGECCVLDREAFTYSRELRRAYEAFCGEQGNHPVSGNVFAKQLTAAGRERERDRDGQRRWRGIALVSPPNSPTPLCEDWGQNGQ